jgi:hypothetical protein
MTCQLLDMSKRLRRLHIDYGLNLLQIVLDSSFRDEVAQQLACGYSEGAFLWIELDAVSIEVGEGFPQIVEQAICLRGPDDNVVDVDLNVATDLLLQARLHAPLIGGSCVLQPEGHRRVAVYPMRGDERSLVLVFDL